MINSFGQDYNVGHIYPGNKFDLDAAERLRLGRVILNILDRYALADIVYVNEKGDRVPVRREAMACRREPIPAIGRQCAALGGTGRRKGPRRMARGGALRTRRSLQSPFGGCIVGGAAEDDSR